MNTLPHFFDSIRLVIPVMDNAAAEAAFPISRETSTNNPDGTPRSTRHRHFLALSTEYPGAPSWWSPPTIQFLSGKLVLEFSIPKFWYGHSAIHAGLDHFELALQAWELWFNSRGVETVPWPDWQIREIHFSYNFKMNSPYEVQRAERQLARLRFRGKLAFQDKSGTHPYWASEDRTIKFYQKGDEMWNHRKKNGSRYDEDWLKARLFSLNKILRFEDEWRDKTLLRFCGIGTERNVGTERKFVERAKLGETERRQVVDRTEFSKRDLISLVTVSRFIKSLEKWTVKEHFQFIQDNFTARSPADSLQEVRKQIRRLRRRVEMEDFLDAVLSRGLSQVKSEMPNSTFHKKKADFKKLGYPIDFFDSFFDPENIVGSPDLRRFQTVDISQYINYENLCRDFDCENISYDPIFLEAQSLVSETSQAIYRVS